MVGLILRLAVILLCIAAWWWLGARGQEKGMPQGMLMIVGAHVALVLAALVMARPLAGLIGDWMSGLFMPGDRHSRPQPMYSIAEGRVAAEDYAGALEAYSELAVDFPEEIAPHLRMMEIWLRAYRDPAAALTIRDNALLTLKGKKNKAGFANAARVILTEAGVES
ncbi:MAG: hypothetical protein WEB31_03280 [Chthoniobacterales bacterium]